LFLYFHIHLLLIIAFEKLYRKLYQDRKSHLEVITKRYNAHLLVTGVTDLFTITEVQQTDIDIQSLYLDMLLFCK